jgi:hypothetical protein
VSVSKDFEELFARLNARGVKALVVDAHAVAYYAKPRFTKDFDLFVEPRMRRFAYLHTPVALAIHLRVSC